jgi:hypothetical protein
MFRLNLLIVEDDQKTNEDWRMAIERHNAEAEKHGFEIRQTIVESAEQAKEALELTRVDAAVVDLRLKVSQASKGHNASGNEVIKVLSETAVTAIAVYTGQPNEADLPFGSSIQVFEKGAGLAPVLDWICSQSELVHQMQIVGSAIQRDMASIFHSSIWPRWAYWFETGSRHELKDALTRHFISHLHASLMAATKGRTHSEEAYFVPVAGSSPVATGDLILGRASKDSVEIVITPRCDLAVPDRCVTVQLAACRDIAGPWKAAQTKGDKALNVFRQHERAVVQHFLPEMRVTKDLVRGPWFVRFDEIVSIALDQTSDADLRSKRFGALTSEYLPNLVQRLGTYFGRIGGPDLS